MSDLSKLPLKVSIKTFGWPMDGARYDLASQYYDSLCYYIKISYEKMRSLHDIPFLLPFLENILHGNVN